LCDHATQKCQEGKCVSLVEQVFVDTEIKERYERAVESLSNKLQSDRTVIAAVLFGSLAYDSVWEKSDIDLQIIMEESVKESNFTLTEESISIHANLMPRSKFKQIVEGDLQGSFGSSIMTRSRLLFSKDESLTRLWENIGPMGRRDQQIQLLQAANMVLPSLVKAEKWCYIKKDYHYATFYILTTTNALAKLEVISAGESPGREVIAQALKLNPTLFHRLYQQVMDESKTEANIKEALELIDAYLTERITLCFQPILDYLGEAGSPRGTREMNEYFKRHYHAGFIDNACDWLASKGIVERVGIPIRLTKDSRVTVDEAGYYWHPDLP
jgi:uncharacterized protein